MASPSALVLPPRTRRVGIVAAVLAVAVLTLAGIAGACVVSAVRFGEHPAYVRVTVQLTAGTIGVRNVEATDPDPFDGSAALRISRAGIRTRVSVAHGAGITVRIASRTGRLALTLAAARHRFKYLSYSVLGGTRLAIDLWRSAPPSRAAEIRRWPGGCLVLDRSATTPGLVTASGRARFIFENQFPLILRAANGTVLARRTMHVNATTGRWSGQLNYRISRGQPGTLEAVDFSQKDGSLHCIVQIRVALAPPLAVQVKVLSSYPQPCLRAVPRVRDAGRVATLQKNNTLAIGSPLGGSPIVRTFTAPGFPGGSYRGGVPLVGWSPDGRYVAVRTGNLWTDTGVDAGKLFATPAVGSWTWSPSSHCALAVTAYSTVGATLTVGMPGRASRPFLSGPIDAFAFSPDGRTLYMVAGRAPAAGRFLALDLATGRVRDIGPAPGSACCVTFGGFAPGGRILLFWAGEGASVMADGASLHGIDTAHGNRIVTYGTTAAPVLTLPDRSFVTACGGNLLAVVGGGRIQNTVSDKRLALVAVGQRPVYLTPPTLAYLSPSCSGDGFSVAAVQYRNGGKIAASGTLTTVTVKNGDTSHPAPAAVLLDVSPEWGVTGFLYGRARAGSDSLALWYVGPGGGPGDGGARDTGLRALNYGLQALAWDWSATPPLGIG